ncbi:MAG: nucleotidyltransferase family protein [Planctomycetes bacterium]|nr:nucleotidyltransferase family protein [Planctomycetota bacterium]
MHAPRLFAVVPAAGYSRRMGRPKLLLPYGGSTVVGQMLAVLSRPEITQTLVVIRPDDAPLKQAVVQAGACPLQPATDPPEMRHSVEIALREIESRWAPAPDDGWILIPADHPLLEPQILDRLLAIWPTARNQIIVPTCLGRRGHPTILPWAFAAEVFALPADQGLNRIVRTDPHRVLEVPLDIPGVVSDLDTPDDYARLLAQSQSTLAADDTTPTDH